MGKGLFIYPWDIIDEGFDNIVRSLNGMQASSVSLAVSYHQAKVLLPHNPKRRVFIHKSGRSYFPFNCADYGCLKPQAGEVLENYSGVFLTDTVKELHRRGINVDAWTVVFHNSRLAGSHPECALHNAYGEPSSSSLCPSHPETFRYGLQMLLDIASAGVDSIHTESVDYAGFLHGDHHEMHAYENTTMMERLLGLCFCESCMARGSQAGVDVKGLQKKVIDKTEGFLRLKTIDLSDIKDELESYQSMQRDVITQFYGDLKAGLTGRSLKTRVVPILWLAGGSNPYQYGMDVEKITEITDGIIAAYPAAPEQVAQIVAHTRRMAPKSKEIIGGIRLMAPHTTKPSQVKEYMRQYRENGIDKVLFYNYGMTPQPFLDELTEGVCNG